MNHKAEAERLLDEAKNNQTGSIVENSRQMQALVHATLAVAEQQRIANLIALGSYQHADGSRPFQSFVAVPSGMYSMALDADIRDGLGL